MKSKILQELLELFEPDRVIDQPRKFTKTEVEKMLADSVAETKDAMTAIIEGFKGDGAPPVGGPAQPTDTVGDFSGWNKEIEAIKENNKN